MHPNSDADVTSRDARARRSERSCGRGEPEWHLDSEPEVDSAATTGADGAVVAGEGFGVICDAPEAERLVARRGAAVWTRLPIVDPAAGVPLTGSAAKIFGPALLAGDLAFAVHDVVTGRRDGPCRYDRNLVVVHLASLCPLPV
jgi:hypothetical protein